MVTYQVLCEATAYHEAGHVVAALHCGRLIKLAAVRGDFGVAEIESSFPPAPESPIQPTKQTLRLGEQEVVISLSGPVAEARFHGLEIYDLMSYDVSAEIPKAVLGYGGDFRAVDKIYDRRLCQVLPERLLQRAKRLLRGQRWRAVCAIADALMVQSYLSGDQLLEIHDRYVKPARLSG